MIVVDNSVFIDLIIQVESARKFGVEAYYLLEEFDRVKEKIGRS